jgi:sugar/nucleoside kinase (ribokinase family)
MWSINSFRCNKILILYRIAVINSMINIHILGDLNLDIILSGLEDLPTFGEEILASGCVMKPGGSAANVAIMLAVNDCPVSLFAQVGNDHAGKLLLQDLLTFGIDTETISISKQGATGLTVSLTFSKDRMYITHPGVVRTTSRKHLVDRYIESHTHLHLTSYFLQAALRREVGKILRTAKTAGMSTSLDPGGDTNGHWDISDLREHFQFLDYFMPNSDEICAITDRDELHAALLAFPKEAQAVIVKAGAHGALTRYHGEIEEYPAMPATVVDTTCAGDCFDAGFLFGLYRGETFQNAVQRGLQFGAQAVSTLGLPSDDIDHFLTYAGPGKD